MYYQWGRKDPFAFATSSEKWGVNTWQAGKYPVKIYTIDGVLIYQVDNGGDNKDKQPVGGIIYSTIVATSMLETIKNPITFYGDNSAVLNQVGYTKDLWNYYWTAHSRGIDGVLSKNRKTHNEYLNGYTSQRSKSIYDPCTYGFRIQSNGTYNNFNENPGWINGSYIGGVSWDLQTKSWFSGLGRKNFDFGHFGSFGWYITSVIQSSIITYPFLISADKSITYTGGNNHEQSKGLSVRCIEFRQSAPTDGRDPFVNSKGQNAFYTSKQNSDAKGMFYQWGRKDPFTFATSSEMWGVASHEKGKYPIKIYTIDGVLIYQENNGSSNKDKQPVGGVIYSSTVATSMMETIKSPITFYGGREIISQTDHTKSLWDYYWTSYSRGTDGNNENTVNHNIYLDDYISQRPKSIYDPCPFGFKIVSNGSYNDFKTDKGWVHTSYAGGVIWGNNNKTTWMLFNGSMVGSCWWTGVNGAYYMGVRSNTHTAYSFNVGFDLSINVTGSEHGCTWARSVRCIDFLFLQRSSVRPYRRT